MDQHNYLIELAKKNLCDGIIEEPRFFYDVISVPTGGAIVGSAEDVFRNGEQFPMRLTHMVVAVRATPTVFVPPLVIQLVNEDLIQRVGMRLVGFDHFYQSKDLAPVAVWSNIPTAAGDAVTPTTATWVFERPFILSARDSLEVTAISETNVVIGIEDVVPLGVGFSGIGLQSKRPYFWQAEAELEGGGQGGTPLVATLSTDRYRNGGAEPVAVTDMVVSVPLEPGIAYQPIRIARINARQMGNGTNEIWGTGPVGLDQCPANLFGVSSGRNMVHRFPGDGLLWEPGEGIDLELAQLVGGALPADLSVVVGLFGYVSIV